MVPHPLEFLWASHVFPGQVSGSELVVEAVLADTLSQRSPSLPPLWESAAIANLHLHSAIDPFICSPPDAALWIFLIHYFQSIHSLTKQTSLGHPLCARHFREPMRIKFALPSKKADAQGMRHTHSELWLWYMLDMRKCLQRLSRKETDKHLGKDFPETMTIKMESGRWEEIF